MKKLIAIVLVLMFAFAAVAEESTITKIVFGTNPEFPPFEYVVSEDGVAFGANGEQYDGIDMAIVAKIGEMLGCEVEIVNLEFDSLLIALENGQIDATIAGMTITEERKLSVDFASPYYLAAQVMIVPVDSDITCAADLEGKLVAVVAGYTGETWVDEAGYKYESFKKGTECIMELMNGKCDAVVLDSATAASYIAGIDSLKIVEDAEAFGGEEYGIAVKQGNTELLDAINACIDAMLADGTIGELSTYYQELDLDAE